MLVEAEIIFIGRGAFCRRSGFPLPTQFVFGSMFPVVVWTNPKVSVVIRSGFWTILPFAVVVVGFVTWMGTVCFVVPSNISLFVMGSPTWRLSVLFMVWMMIGWMFPSGLVGLVIGIPDPSPGSVTRTSKGPSSPFVTATRPEQLTLNSPDCMTGKGWSCPSCPFPWFLFFSASVMYLTENGLWPNSFSRNLVVEGVT